VKYRKRPLRVKTYSSHSKGNKYESKVFDGSYMPFSVGVGIC